MTYEEELGIAIVGACPYGCGFQSKISSWSRKAYSPLPENVSSLNDAMCGGLIKMVECVVNIRKDSVLWSIPTSLIA
jgi:hypothetical protein